MGAPNGRCNVCGCKVTTIFSIVQIFLTKKVKKLLHTYYFTSADVKSGGGGAGDFAAEEVVEGVVLGGGGHGLKGRHAEEIIHLLETLGVPGFDEGYLGGQVGDITRLVALGVEMCDHALPCARGDEQVAVALELGIDRVGREILPSLQPAAFERSTVGSIVRHGEDRIRRVVVQARHGPVGIVAVVVRTVVCSAEAGVEVPRGHDRLAFRRLHKVPVVDVRGDVADGEEMVLVAPVVGDGQRHDMQLVISHVVEVEILLYIRCRFAVVEHIQQWCPGLNAGIVLGKTQLPRVVPFGYAGQRVGAERALVLRRDVLGAGLVEHAADGLRVVGVLLDFLQVQQLAVDAVGHAVDAVVGAVDVHLDEASLGAVAAVELGHDPTSSRQSGSLPSR